MSITETNFLANNAILLYLQTKIGTNFAYLQETSNKDIKHEEKTVSQINIIW